jgi:hypothetical protein
MSIASASRTSTRKTQWQFDFVKHRNCWRWLQIDNAAHEIVASSEGDFATFRQCVADAEAHGYVSPVNGP